MRRLAAITFIALARTPLAPAVVYTVKERQRAQVATKNDTGQQKMKLTVSLFDL